jgi:CrcB protein
MSSLRPTLAIAMGGAVGALFRFWLATGVYGVAGRDFPYGTLAVNVVGCLVMGLLYEVLLDRVTFGVELRAGLLIGLSGAFTTFSTFSLETLALVEQGEPTKALANVILSVLLCMGAVWVGVFLGRQL